MRWEGGKKRRRRVLGSKTDFALTLDLFTKYTKYGGITRLVIHLQQRVLGSKTDFFNPRPLHKVHKVRRNHKTGYPLTTEGVRIEN